MKAQLNYLLMIVYCAVVTAWLCHAHVVALGL